MAHHRSIYRGSAASEDLLDLPEPFPMRVVAALAGDRTADCACTDDGFEATCASPALAHSLIGTRPLSGRSRGPARHLGWADTSGVQGPLPTFCGPSRPILRAPAQGADAFVWPAGAGRS